MLKFFRRNTVAFVALFIALGGTAYAANTVRSADIVDGAVHTQDLANNAVTAAKSTGLFTYHYTNTQLTSSCATVANTWHACAPVYFTIPSGHYYVVTVISSMNAYTGPGDGFADALFCAATTGPSCVNGNPDYTSFPGNHFASATSTATAYFPAGSYAFSTAMKWGYVLPSNQNARTTTTIIATDDANTSTH